MKEPENWLIGVIGAVGGAGLAKLAAVWLENRRMTGRDFRETLIDRIEDLERQVASCQTRIGNLREHVGNLEYENRSLKLHIKQLEEELEDESGADS